MGNESKIQTDRRLSVEIEHQKKIYYKAVALKKQSLLETQLLTIKSHNERFRNFTHIVSHNLRSHLTNLKSVIRITDTDNKENVKSAFDMINQTVSSMTESPKIVFSLRFDGDYKILSVSDNGRGIDLEK